MALPVTSGLAAFLVTRDQVIQAAMRSLRVLRLGQTPDAEDVTNCAYALNTLLKEANILGKMRWVYQTISIPFVANQITYTIAEIGANLLNYRPIAIAHAWRRDQSTPPIDTPMSPLSRQGYDQLTPKTTTGVPTNYYYDPQIGLSTVYVWPAPSDATYTLYLCIQRPIQDITSATQNFDVTQEWFSTLRWLLAEEVASEFEVDSDTLRYVSSMAKRKREALADFSQEDAPVNLQPDPQAQYGSRFNS